MTPRVPAIVDTNVVVSGLITRGKGSPSARILDAMLGGRLRFVVSVPLLAEYRTVLLRPRVCSFHGLTEAEVDRILTRLVENGTVREPGSSTTAAPDPGDDHLWALLDTVPAAVLVTGDRALLDDPPEGRSVISPRSFVELP